MLDGYIGTNGPHVEPERRLKLVRLPQHVILDWFVGALAGFPRYVKVPELNLPAGCKVLAVHDDFMTSSFVFIVHHPDWPEVQPACMIPDAGPVLARSFVIELPQAENLPTIVAAR